nr:neutral/alkaline non-lysosomal ceramidase N-terminal domain-containing protein [Candidatus Sigynarchaeota archaeon]
MGITIGTASTRFDLPVGIPMGGYSGRNAPSTGEHDPLHTKTIAIGNGNDTIVIASCDLVGLERTHVLEVKERIQQRFGIPVANIMITATHTHSGPRNIALFGDPYKGFEKLYGTIDASISAAVQAMKPASIAVATGKIEGVSFNRRTYDPTSEHVDDTCTVLVVKEALSGKKEHIVAILYNFACHPVVMGAENLDITADWVYYANERIAEAFPGALPIFLQGSCGNLNPVNTPIIGFVPVHTFDDCKEIGNKAGSAIVKIAKKTSLVKIDSVKGTLKEIEVLSDDPDKAEIFTFAAGKVHDGKFSITAPVQALSFDDIAIAGVPGELFSEISLNIKKRSMFKHVLVAGYANDYIGYIATRANYQAKGYEVVMMSLSEEEGELVEKSAIDAVNSLKK